MRFGGELGPGNPFAERIEKPVQNIEPPPNSSKRTVDDWAGV